MEKFTYHVIKRGKIILSDTIAVPKRKYHVFKVLATFELLPKAELFVYYMDDNEIVSKQVDLKVEHSLINFVNLKLSKVRVSPADDVNITVYTEPDSYIGLYGVDQSVLLLKQNKKELSVENALDEVERYQETRYQEYPEYISGYNQDSVIRQPHMKFQSGTVVLFSNAKTHSKIFKSHFGCVIYFFFLI